MQKKLLLRVAIAALLSLPAAAALAQAEAPDSALPPRPPAAPVTPAEGPSKAPAKAKRAPKAAPAAAPSAETPVDPYASPEVSDASSVMVPTRLGLSDLGAMQGLLAVQRLGGWLLRDRGGDNPVALRLVAPIFRPQNAWIYLVPVTGEPVVLCHQQDAGAFEKVRGKVMPYSTAKEWDKALKGLLRGRKTLAMELVEQGPGKPALPPADLRAALRAARVSAQSSEHLQQYTSAIWGKDGLLSHHLAAHHVVALRKEALAFIAERLRAKAAVTDKDVVAFLDSKMAMRGVVGERPIVVSGVRTATPAGAVSSDEATPIAAGDLVLVRLAIKQDKPGAVYAAQSWVAVAGAAVPEAAARAFAEVVKAREVALELIARKLRNRQPVRGADVDAAVRRSLAKSYPAERVLHAAGRSIDSALPGSGASLDSVEKKDARVLVVGTGVTLGPGLYFPGEHGVMSEVTVYFSSAGPVVTTPAQTAIEALLAP